MIDETPINLADLSQSNHHIERETGQAVAKSLGRIIEHASIDPHRNLGNGVVILRFTDGSALELCDGWQSCCESRYLVCDDDLSDLVGKGLWLVEVASAPNVEDDYGCHEVDFLRIHAQDAMVCVSAHNEHNGYYGGINLEARFIPAGDSHA